MLQGRKGRSSSNEMSCMNKREGAAAILRAEVSKRQEQQEQHELQERKGRSSSSNMNCVNGRAGAAAMSGMQEQK